MPLYMLDTDICSYVIKNRPPEVRQKMNAVPLDQQAISVVTYAELLYGVKRSSSQRVNRQVVDAFVRHLTVLEWNADAAEHYADLRTHLEIQGTPNITASRNIPLMRRPMLAARLDTLIDEQALPVPSDRWS